MKKMIVLLSTLLMAIVSASAVAVDTPPAKAGLAATDKVQAKAKAKAKAKYAKKHKKVAEKMRGNNIHPDQGCNDGLDYQEGRGTCTFAR